MICMSVLYVCMVCYACMYAMCVRYVMLCMRVLYVCDLCYECMLRMCVTLYVNAMYECMYVEYVCAVLCYVMPCRRVCDLRMRAMCVCTLCRLCARGRLYMLSCVFVYARDACMYVPYALGMVC